MSIEKEGITSAVLTANRVNKPNRPFSTVYVAAIKKVFNGRLTHALAFRFELLPYLIDYDAWEMVIDEFKPDVIHCHTGHAVKTCIHVSERLGLNIPLVASLHGSDVNSEPLIRKKYQRVLSKAGKKKNVFWTVPSKFLRQKTIQNLAIPKDKISIVYNAINRCFTTYTSNVEFDELRIICVGRFIPCKGHIFLIEAFSMLLEQYPRAQLTLVGSGALENELAQQIKSMNMQHQVKIISYINHDELPSLLSEHNIYVQPSIKDDVTAQEESFGVAALEAMAMGLPTVVTECGGLSELASVCLKDTIQVVKQKDSRGLMEAVRVLFEAKPLQSLKNRERIKDTFSNERNVTSIVKIYEESQK
ncbi:glycosyltransferase family 4 protein [Pseudoalteromonas sp. JBTF-M23]|uniref:Glycosyltransferase family 4 protein n=2 Tax=Pseudoalteromonas caenipelagi TaxID=2726988 RepID=A0A849VGF1_9GAMM|nr:glycosyltransferase family 4 protein [Pseudoalteromonas caenipelagi]